jgi:hypothetical protein
MHMFVGADNDQLTPERGTSSDRGGRQMVGGRDARPHSIDDNLAAWLAEYGHLPQPAAVADCGSTDPTPEAAPDGRPEAEFLLRLSAQKLFAEGRVNPMSIPCVTWVGTWRTDDRVTWRTEDGAWLAQLERSNNRRHLSLAIFHHGVYQGRQDASGFYLPTGQSRTRRPRPTARSLRLPLAG